MSTLTDDEALACSTAAKWRAWLAANGRTERSVWLIVHRDAVGVGLADAVEQALCFGWIDSKTVKRDDKTTYQCFTPRNPRSTWSKVNRDRVERLTEAGLMAAPGQELIDLAKRTGTWDLLADAQNLIVPADLAAALAQNPLADQHFQAFPPSARRAILEWITLAKRPETRASRIEQTVEQAAQNVRAR
ncbi:MULTISPECIES: YdeI/OmpD-associated family protein [unclassified Kribbella]|uniref:YdeI/OmpD-associated family protein n=1 Tax=unclassified Kribbella TaxID=2644121 RepID=UPI003016E8CF